MKILSLMLLLTLISCNGAGTNDASQDDGDPFGGIDQNTCLDQNNTVISCTPSNQPLVIEYNSNGLYQNTGISLDTMGTFDQQRPIIIPQYLNRLQDSANSISVNDIARIVFVTDACTYRWNGTQFAFVSCNGNLSSNTFGDVIYLHDLHNSLNPQMDGIIQMGVVRNPAINHTGIIRIQANLQ